MAWFAVRSLYLFGDKVDGTNIFEERIVCIQARDAAEAVAIGADESEEYARQNNFESHHLRDSYEQDGCALIDGYELWSQLYEAKLSLEEFYSEHYAKYDYDSETD